METIELENELIKDENFEDFKSKYRKCYVYELSVKDTGEIFYVGRDSEEKHDVPFDVFSPLRKGWANRISQQIETEKRILKTGLRESVANHYVLKRIKEISSDNMLCDRENCSYPSYELMQVGAAPKIEVCPIEQYYLGKTAVSFDKVDLSNLSAVYIDSSFCSSEMIAGLYGTHFDEYYNELKRKLEVIGTKIIKSKYAKSIKAWIYLGRISRLEYEKVQNYALQKLGRNIPTYHLFDILEVLKDVTANSTIDSTLYDVEINPIHNRCPLSDIRNLNDWRAAYREGAQFAQKGEELRLAGDIEAAISYFDKARECGFDVYDSYAKAYRKIKDFDNEIAILMECYEYHKTISGNDHASSPFFIELKEKIDKAKQRLIQSRSK